MDPQDDAGRGPVIFQAVITRKVNARRKGSLVLCTLRRLRYTRGPPRVWYYRVGINRRERKGNEAGDIVNTSSWLD